MKKSYDDGKVLIRWDEDVKTEKTNFWELLKLQTRLFSVSTAFGVCVMVLVGLTTSDIVRGTCAHVAERDYGDWTVQKSEFFLCAMNHWNWI